MGKISHCRFIFIASHRCWLFGYETMCKIFVSFNKMQGSFCQNFHHQNWIAVDFGSDNIFTCYPDVSIQLVVMIIIQPYSYKVDFCQKSFKISAFLKDHWRDVPKMKHYKNSICLNMKYLSLLGNQINEVTLLRCWFIILDILISLICIL